MLTYRNTSIKRPLILNASPRINAPPPKSLKKQKRPYNGAFIRNMLKLGLFCKEKEKR